MSFNLPVYMLVYMWSYLKYQNEKESQYEKYQDLVDYYVGVKLKEKLVNYEKKINLRLQSDS